MTRPGFVTNLSCVNFVSYIPTLTIIIIIFVITIMVVIIIIDEDN